MVDQNKLNEVKALLNELTPSERAKILKEEKERKKKERMEKKKSLTILFQKQMETLKSRGCHFEIINVFKKLQEAVISIAVEMEIPTENIPFLPVIPKDYLGIYGLASLLKKEGGEINITIIPNEIVNDVEIPKGLYFIFNVEVGKKMLNKKPELAKELVEIQNFSCLTIEEGIALGIHGEHLFEHWLDCTGSRIGNHGVPGISLNNSENCVTVFYCRRDHSGIRQGSPYCSVRKNF